MRGWHNNIIRHQLGYLTINSSSLLDFCCLGLNRFMRNVLTFFSVPARVDSGFSRQSYGLLVFRIL